MTRLALKSFAKVGLIVALGLSSVFAGGKEGEVKQPKNTGTLSVKTTDRALAVKVDGQYMGMSGVNEEAKFYLTPGVHKVEIEGPDGKTWVQEVEIVKGRKNCICLKLVSNKKSWNCPYDITVDGPEKVMDGDLITFAALNVGTKARDNSTTSTSDGSTVVDGANSGNVGTTSAGNNVAGDLRKGYVVGGAAAAAAPVLANALNYAWKISPSTARVTSGLGTSAVTVDTSGLGGQTIRAELDVTDGVYDATCRQNVAAMTSVEKPNITIPPPVRCDIFETNSFDDDKARFDNCVISLQSYPESQLYMFIYQGVDKAGKTKNSFDRLSKRSLDYFVKTRLVAPDKVQIVRGGDKPRTTYEIWIVPPGAQVPVPN